MPRGEHPMKRLGRRATLAVSGFLLLAYFLGFILAARYYDWQYARDSGLVGSLFGAIVSTAKALAWPYFVFFASSSTDGSGGGQDSLSFLNYFFVKTIHGIGAITVAVYGVFVALRKALPKLPHPAVIAGPVFLIALFTVASVPRYQFERDTMAKIEGKDWIHVVDKTKWGSLTEPLTWVRTPVGAVTIIMPNSPIDEGVFRQVTMRYEEKTRVFIVEPDCSALTIIYASPDKDGIFQYTSNSPSKMDAVEEKWYCQHDWTKEKEALRKEALRQMKEAPQ
jgi:hypothetical protein